ncbi:MAG: NAD-binding protein [Candidatus Aenigmarchaeota archaeon]|nr:NAD-binding protein [Candidatus Aenigmarchaeota archaeon]
MKIIIAGGGKYGEKLAEALVREKNSVVVIEKDEARAENIGGSLNALVLNGDASSSKILKDAGVDSCDALICMTDNDTTNLKICEAAKALGVKSLVSRINNPNSLRDFEELNIPTVNATESAVNAFKAMIDRRQKQVVAEVAAGKFHIIERVVDKGSGAVGKKFDKISKDIIPVGIYREGKFSAKPGAKIEEGDTIIFCVPKDKLKETEKLF